MASVGEHYDRHLGPVYSWMAGGTESALAIGAAELDALGIQPSRDGEAVDLGAGFGMHTVPLAQRGFRVVAIDSCGALLDELRGRAAALSVRVVQDDLRSFSRYLAAKPDLVLCMGDTVAHLEDKLSVAQLIEDVAGHIKTGGCFVVSLRDYSTPLIAEQRFIPVRSSDHRLLTCFLEYSDSHVTVHDILQERIDGQWQMTVSRYVKLRLPPDWLAQVMEENGFTVSRQAARSGMLRLVGVR